MDKIIRKFEIEYAFDWKYGVEIGQIQKDLDALKELGVTHIEIDSSLRYDTCTTTIEAFCERLETDEECLKRMADDQRCEDAVRASELKQLKELKEKYEK